MGRPTLSDSEELEPEALSCIDIRPGQCFDVADLSSLQKVTFHTSESKGPLPVTQCNLEDDAVFGAEGPTVEIKEQPGKSLRKKNVQQHKTAKIGERGVLCCILQRRKYPKGLLVLLLSLGCLIAGCDGARLCPEDFNLTVIKKKPGEQVKVQLGYTDKCRLDFLKPAKRRYETICDRVISECLLGYKIEAGNLLFTASNETAGCYVMIDDDTNEIVACVRQPEDPPKSGASSDMVADVPPKSGASSSVPGLLMALGLAVLGFFIHPF